MFYNAKNHTEQGGDVTRFGGKVIFEEGCQIDGLPQAENLAPKTTDTASGIRSDLNVLINRLKNAGIMEPDTWNLSVLAVPAPAAMPTEQTKDNSSHATVSVSDGEITIALDCKVSDLDDADHGGAWGVHKWLGFGVRTGLASVVGVTFTDDTGASVTLGADDASEASALGLSAGDFVLYIKAEQDGYLEGAKSFSLWCDGHEVATYTMKITETLPGTAD